MMHISELIKGTEARMIEKSRGDFPSYAHEVAWIIAEDVSEPYNFWVRQILNATLNPGQILHEWNVLKYKPYTRRQKVKMLMSTMKLPKKAV